MGLGHSAAASRAGVVRTVEGAQGRTGAGDDGTHQIEVGRSEAASGRLTAVVPQRFSMRLRRVLSSAWRSCTGGAAQARAKARTESKLLHVVGYLMTSHSMQAVSAGNGKRTLIQHRRERHQGPDRRTGCSERRSPRPAHRAAPRRQLHDGRYRPLGVRAVLHGKPVVPGASARTAARPGPVQLPDPVRHACPCEGGGRQSPPTIPSA
jgi:hypothetical protein